MRSDSHGNMLTAVLPLVVIVIVAALPTTSLAAEPGWLKDAIAAAETAEPHSDAPALVLCDRAEIKISSNGSSERRVRWAVRVLKSEGTDAAAFEQRVSSDRRVEGLKGWRISPNGSAEILDPDRVSYFGWHQAAGYYDDDQTMSASFSSVRTGDVVAFEYTLKEKAGWDGYFQSFRFQSHLPVVSSRLEVDIPGGWELLVSEYNLEPVTHSRAKDKFVWEAGYLPYRPPEPYLPDDDILARRLLLSCYDPSADKGPHFSSWRDASRWVSDLFQEVADPDEGIRSLTDELTADAASDWRKLAAIAEYVRDEIRYVAVEIDEGRFRPRPAPTTYRNRFGDCKDKVALLRAMLTAADIPNQPVLVRVGGPVDSEFYSPFQFNHAIIAVPVDGLAPAPNFSRAVRDGWLYFDPTDPAIPFGMLPLALAGAHGLKASPRDTSLAILPVAAPTDRLRVYRATATVLPDYSLSAQVAMVDYRNLAAEADYRRRTTPPSDQIERFQKRFAASMKSPTLTDYRTGTDADSAWVTFELSGKKYVDVAGELLVLKPDFFFPANIEELDCDKRVHPISFGYVARYETDITWKIPEEWMITGLPEPVDARCEVASVTCLVDTTAQIRIRSVREYSGGTLPKEGCREAEAVVRGLREYSAMRLLLRE